MAWMDVQNGFAFVLQFFSLISDRARSTYYGLGGVTKIANVLSISFYENVK